MTTRRSPPGETQLIALGMNDESFAALADMTTRHHTVFQVPSRLKETQYVLMHPSEVRHVLLTNYRNYKKGRTFRSMKALMGNGLIVQDGELWRQQRKMLQPLFHERVILETTSIMRAHLARLVERWSASARKGQRVNVTHDVSQSTLHTLLEALFSEDLGRMARPDGKNPFELLIEDTSRTIQLVPKFRQTLRHIVDVVEARRRESRLPPDFLSMLMEARDGEGRPMPIEQLCDEVATLIVAGHETTATVLTWSWLQLARHRDVETRFHEEIGTAAPDPGDRHQLPKLRYTPWILFEVLRMFPPVWLDDRQAIEDDVLGDYHVPAGTEILIPIYFLHRDSRFFEDATVFRPERFATYQVDRRYRELSSDRRKAADTPWPAEKERRSGEDRRSASAQEHSTFVPFGTGPRRCIGDQFALLNAQLHLWTIGRKLAFTHAGDDVALEPRVNLRPHGDIFLRPRLRT